MTGDFSVEPAAVRSAARSFADQKEVPEQLSTKVSGARAVDTGDAGVNGQIGGVVDRLSSLLTRYSEALGLDSQALDQMADSYEKGDGDVADSFDRIQTPGRSSGGSGQTAPARPPLTSSLGIAAKPG